MYRSKTFCRMKLGALVVLGMLQLVSLESRADDGWIKFQSYCSHLSIPNLSTFTGSAREWQVQEISSQGELEKLVRDVCPSYLQQANSALSVNVKADESNVTLARYTETQTQAFANAIESNKNGLSHHAFLSLQYGRLRKTLGSYGVNVNNTLCGKLLVERKNFVQGELSKIAKKIDGMNSTCSGLASKLMESAVKKKAARAAGQIEKLPPVERIPASMVDKRPSTITGEIKSDNKSRESNK